MVEICPECNKFELERVEQLCEDDSSNGEEVWERTYVCNSCNYCLAIPQCIDELKEEEYLPKSKEGVKLLLNQKLLDYILENLEENRWENDQEEVDELINNLPNYLGTPLDEFDYMQLKRNIRDDSKLSGLVCNLEYVEPKTHEVIMDDSAFDE